MHKQLHRTALRNVRSGSLRTCMAALPAGLRIARVIAVTNVIASPPPSLLMSGGRDH